MENRVEVFEVWAVGPMSKGPVLEVLIDRFDSLEAALAGAGEIREMIEKNAGVLVIRNSFYAAE